MHKDNVMCEFLAPTNFTPFSDTMFIVEFQQQKTAQQKIAFMLRALVRVTSKLIRKSNFQITFKEHHKSSHLLAVPSRLRA